MVVTLRGCKRASVLVTRGHVWVLYLFTYCHTFQVCLFFFINALAFWSQTMPLKASGNYLQKCSWLNSLDFAVNPEPDNELAWQLFVLAGYFQANGCTISLSGSYQTQPFLTPQCCVYVSCKYTCLHAQYCIWRTLLNCTVQHIYCHLVFLLLF